MRTNIDINDALIAQAMQLTGARTKREAVERGLQQLIQTAQRPTLRSMFGSGGIADDYDYAKLRVQPNYLTQFTDDIKAQAFSPNAGHVLHSPVRSLDTAAPEDTKAPFKKVRSKSVTA